MTELEQVPGCGPAKAKKLRDAFITTVELLAVQNPVESISVGVRRPAVDGVIPAGVERITAQNPVNPKD